MCQDTLYILLACAASCGDTHMQAAQISTASLQSPCDLNTALILEGGPQRNYLLQARAFSYKQLLCDMQHLMSTPWPSRSLT